MNSIQNFSALVDHLKANEKKLRIAVVCGSDESTLTAVERALSEGFAEVIFSGHTERIQQRESLSAYQDLITYVVPSGETDADAAKDAVQLVRNGEADILMKGLVNTDVLLRAVLNKEEGLLPRGKVLTHVTLAQLPQLDHLLFFTDVAVMPYPTQEQRAAQIEYTTNLCHAMGIECPKISLIHCSEKVSDKFPHTVGYAELKERAAAGEWGKVIVDGPLDVRTSLDAETLHTKGIISPLEGKADVLVFPDIEAGNAFYKTITLLCGGDVAGMLCGTVCPVVLPSRGDSASDKFYSLAFAAIGCGVQ